MYDKVVFSIDNFSDLHVLAKFLRLMDTKASMGDVKGGFDLCVGYFENAYEYSFTIQRVDYLNHVLNSGYVDHQDCVMLVPIDNRQPCTLWSIDLKKHIGTLGRPEVLEKPKGTGWTYFPKTNLFLTA